jgi:hypothetical protein
MTASRTLMGTAARASLATAFMACGATADFTGLSTEANLVDQTGWASSDARTLYVISVFANFDNAADQLIAVFGDTNHVLSVETSDDDGFWQFDGDGSGAPGDYNTSYEISAALSGLYASVTSDSFVTIGLTDSTGNALQNIGMDFTSFNDASISSAITVDNGSWFITPDDPQGTAGNYTDNRVLIGQFTVGEGEDVTGSVSLQWRDDVDVTSYTYATTFEGTSAAGGVWNDFNQDGYGDLLFQESSSLEVRTWLMNSSTILASTAIYGGAGLSDWTFQGIGDFDNDGDADLLWRHNTTSEIRIWFIEGAAIAGATTVYSGAGLGSWTIETIADVNGDGIDDLVFQNTNTQVYYWILDNAGAISSQGYVWAGTPGATWDMQGAGDFNGDGTDDLLWRNTGTSQMLIWTLSNGVLTSASSLYSGSGLSVWNLNWIADLNNDGTDDLLWQTTDSSSVVGWLIAGNAISSSGTIYNGDLSAWAMEGCVDLDGDGYQNIIWRNNSTDQIFQWDVQGTTLNGSGSIYSGAGLSTWDMISPSP